MTTLEQKDKEIATIFNSIDPYQQRLLRNRLTALRSRHGEKCIGQEWDAPYGVGSRRFAVWLWQQYKDLPAGANRSKYCLVLRNKSKKYSPSNCKLVLKKDYLHYKVKIRIPDEEREQIVKMAKDDPTIKLREIALKHKYSLAAISNILRKEIGFAYMRRRTGAVA